MTDKVCSKCKETKSVSEFNRDKSSKSGYKYSCRECDRIAKAKYRTENKDKIKEYRKRYAIEYKDKIKERARRKMILNNIKNFHKNLERKLVDIRRMRFRKNHPEYDRLKYNVWYSMKDRCSNPNNRYYHCYGGKGVKICNEWQDFEVFYEWSINNGYTTGLTIDRIDNDGDYCPKNCRWVTIKVNNRNRGYVKLNEEKVSVIKRNLMNGLSYKRLAKEYGVDPATIRNVAIGRYWSDVDPAKSIV